MRLLVLRLLALLSAAGGPLYLYDDLKRAPQDWQILGFCFAPIAMMLFGSLSFGDPPGARMARGAVRLGLFGAVALALMNAYTVFGMITRPAHPNQLMILAGVTVGFFASAAYTLLARTFLARPRHGDLSGE